MKKFLKAPLGIYDENMFTCWKIYLKDILFYVATKHHVNKYQHQHDLPYFISFTHEQFK